MEGFRKVCFIVLCFAAIHDVTSTIKDSLNIPEKIIGGVIDIVQSHKNKPVPTQQPTFQTNYQYPQYQQWNGQSNYQNQGFQPQPQYQGQYQNQGQYSYQNGYNQNSAQGTNYPQGTNNFPQSGSYGTNQPNYPAGSGQSFNQGQTTSGQGQYLVNQYPNQNGQQSNQFQTSQSGYYTQNQSNNQFQGTTTGSNQFNGQSGFVAQGSGQSSQGFYVNGQQPAGQDQQGPTCICQAWTKPQQDILADPPVTEKIQKKEEARKE